MSEDQIKTFNNSKPPAALLLRVKEGGAMKDRGFAFVFKKDGASGYWEELEGGYAAFKEFERNNPDATLIKW